MRENLRTASPFIFLVIGLALASLSVFLFAHLTDELLENELNTFDGIVMAVVSTAQTAFLDSFMNAVTVFGDVWVIAGFSIVLLLFLFFKKKDSLQGTIFFITTLGSAGLIWLLKESFERQRPDNEAAAAAGSFSFPSGHTLGAFVFYGFLLFLVIRSGMKIWLKAAICTFLVVLVLLIGASRIYLGVHFPTDVAAGYLTGAAWLLFCLLALAWWKEGTVKEKEAGKAALEIVATAWKRLTGRDSR